MQKILLYYKFTPIHQPKMLQLWQKALCEKLELRGRILVSPQGINGTVGGDIKSLKLYRKSMREFPGFSDIVWKWSEGSADNFPKMSIKIKPELVAFDAADEITIDDTGVVGGGQHLKPEQVNQLVEDHGDEVVFFDGRNQYEAKVGRFKNAVVPDTKTSRDFIRELESGKYDDIKNKKVVTYCTGGVRCELLSAMMRKRGFQDVYQLDGGIVKYGEAYRDEGLWEGSLYVFDGRMGMNFSDKAQAIGTCIHCQSKTSNYENCVLKTCNQLVLICEECMQKPANLFHQAICYDAYSATVTETTIV